MLLKQWISRGIIFFSLTLTLSAQSFQTIPEKNTNYIPMVRYDSLELENQSLKTMGAGIVVMSGMPEASDSEVRDNLMIVLNYNRFLVGDNPIDASSPEFSNLGLMLQKDTGRHMFFSVLDLASASDFFVTEGMEKLTFFNGYGYEVIQSHAHSLALGASLVFSNKGVDVGGASWPVMPLPYVRYEYSSAWIAAILEFMGTPVIGIVIAPEKKLRFNSTVLIRDTADWKDGGINYDLSLEYRLFAENHKWGDFAGIRAGYKRQDCSFDPSGKESEVLSLGWNTAYAALDLSFLEISGGYAFSDSFQNSGRVQNMGDGFYISLSMAYKF